MYLYAAHTHFWKRRRCTCMASCIKYCKFICQYLHFYNFSYVYHILGANTIYHSIYLQAICAIKLLVAPLFTGYPLDQNIAFCPFRMSSEAVCPVRKVVGSARTVHRLSRSRALVVFRCEYHRLSITRPLLRYRTLSPAITWSYIPPL
jgi:hypothetical protein